MNNELIISEIVSIEQIQALEVAMREMPQEEIPVNHYFSNGVYAREIFIKKGTTLTGHIHKYSQLNILSKGEISVYTENGIKRISAPFTIVSPAGTKRVAYAHEDCVWTTIHGTHETDLEKIEEKFIVKDHSEYLEFCNKLTIKGE
jgi:quercetin dioxygenase-like cupin family protein